MNKQQFDEGWLEWVRLNVSRGCDITGIHAILVKHNFDPNEALQKIAEASRDNTVLSETATAGSSKTKIVKDNHVPVIEAKQSPRNTGLMIPTGVKLDFEEAEVYSIDKFLSEAECIHLTNHIRNNLRKSTTTNDAGTYADFRTSSTCDLGLIDDTLISDIDKRICRLMGITPEESETIQGQWYEVGQEFKAHTDYFEPGTKEYQEHTMEKGQRTWTVMVYLNTVQEGGQTHFPELDVAFQPVTGTALIWNSLTESGEPNPATLHHAQPVIQGYKAIITKWFRSKDKEIHYQKEANEYILPLTRTGFIKREMPAALFQLLRDYYQQHKQSAQDESVPGFINAIHNEQSAPSQLVMLDQTHKQKVHTLLQPIMEAWVGTYLEPTFVYGIRNYLDGSSLKVHRDRLETHIASAILNIDQQVNEDWPLYIEDHHYRSHEVILKPGEMLMYEGARLSHGRPTPLDGNTFVNVFAHYKLYNPGSG